MQVYHEGVEKEIEEDFKIIKERLLSIAAHSKCNNMQFRFNLDKSKESVKLSTIEYTEIE